MRKSELDSLLYRYTEFEEVLVQNFDWDFIDSKAHISSSSGAKKLGHLPLSKSDIINDINSQIKYTGKNYTLDENFFMFPNEKISFFMHPRVFNTQNYIVQEHRHTFIELIYVYSGRCIQTIEGVKMAMESGDICILDTNVRHSVSVTNRNDIVINCLMRKSYFDASFMGRLSGNDLLSNFFTHAIYQNKSLNNYILFHTSNNEMLQDIMTNVLCEYYDKKMCSDEVIDSYMIILFSELLRIYKSDMNSQNYTALSNTKISDIITYIQHNYKDATLVSTAKYFNFHPNYLSMIFKKLTGIRFIDFLHKAKLEQSCMLLEYTDYTVDKIVNEVGYSNINFFYRLFKKYYGITPSEYRKRKTGPKEDIEAAI